MEFALLVIYVFLGLAIIGLILIQHGKGADMGAAFGSGSAGSLFGSAGSANFLSRSTAGCVLVFFIISIALTYTNSQQNPNQSVMQKTPAKAADTPVQKDDSVPVAPSAPATSAPDASGQTEPASKDLAK